MLKVFQNIRFILVHPFALNLEVLMWIQQRQLQNEPNDADIDGSFVDLRHPSYVVTDQHIDLLTSRGQDELKPNI